MNNINTEIISQIYIPLFINFKYCLSFNIKKPLYSNYSCINIIIISPCHYYTKPAAEGKDVKPAQIPSPGNNSFLEDTFTSDAPKDKQISCGFYRQEKRRTISLHL